MQHRIIVFMFLFLAFLLQMALAPNISLGKVIPDFVLVLVISVAIVEGSRFGSVIGFAGGFLADLLSGGILGIYAFSKTIVGYMVGNVVTMINPEGRYVPALAALLGSVVHLGLVMAITYIFGIVRDFNLFRVNILIQPFYNTFWMILIFPVIRTVLTKERSFRLFR